MPRPKNSAENAAKKKAAKNAAKATLKAAKNAEKSAAKAAKAAVASAAKELTKKMKANAKAERNATRKAAAAAAAAAWRNAQSTAHANLMFATGKAPRVANSQRLAAIRYAGSKLNVANFLKIKNAKNKNKTRKSSGPRENVRNIAPSFNVCEQCKLKKLLESS
jgi:hypothetical protein